MLRLECVGRKGCPFVLKGVSGEGVIVWKSSESKGAEFGCCVVTKTLRIIFRSLGSTYLVSEFVWKEEGRKDFVSSTEFISV